MARVPDELTALIEVIRSAPRHDRIRHRDALAAFGDDAIATVRPWLKDPEFGALAVRVIAAAAAHGSRPTGIAALRDGRAHAATDAIRGDIDFALNKLGAGNARQTTTSEPGVHSIPVFAGDGWPGFKANEFGRIAGTVWRGRPRQCECDAARGGDRSCRDTHSDDPYEPAVQRLDPSAPRQG